MTELRDAACLVTGATGGIGRALAGLLAGRGARLLLTGRDGDELARLAVRTRGTTVVADLTRSEDLARLAAQAGECDVLVCNAGAGWAGDALAMPANALERLVALNLTAPMVLARLLVPGMRARGHGHLVLVGSIAGVTPVGGEAAYSATKAGLAGYAESLRYELEGTGVRVSLVVPGVVDTDFFRRRGAPYDRSWPRPIPARRVAEAIVRAVREDRDEVVVPAWLRLPVRLRGIAPRTYRRLAGRFG